MTDHRFDRSGAEHLLVEFVGLPAAGKTRLASEVRERLLEEFAGINDPATTTSSGKRAAAGLPTVAALVVFRLGRAPIQSATAFARLARTRQRSVTKFARYSLYELYVREEIRRACRRGEVHLADQGFLQHLWRVHLTAHDTTSADLRRVLTTHETFPDLVVCVDVDHRTRMARGVERGTPPAEAAFFDREHPEIQRDIEAYGDLTEAIHEIANGVRSGVEVIRVDNTDDALDENVAMLAEEISTTYRRMQATQE